MVKKGVHRLSRITKKAAREPPVREIKPCVSKWKNLDTQELGGTLLSLRGGVYSGNNF